MKFGKFVAVVILVACALPLTASAHHSADPDADYVISIGELLRAIQYYNSYAYHCEDGTEDGFAPGPGDQSCVVHDSDYWPTDWSINLDELMRLIQFHNSYAYHCEDGTEDGFAPGPGLRCGEEENQRVRVNYTIMSTRPGVVMKSTFTPLATPDGVSSLVLPGTIMTAGSELSANNQSRYQMTYVIDPTTIMTETQQLKALLSDPWQTMIMQPTQVVPLFSVKRVTAPVVPVIDWIGTTNPNLLERSYNPQNQSPFVVCGRPQHLRNSDGQLWNADATGSEPITSRLQSAATGAGIIRYTLQMPPGGILLTGAVESGARRAFCELTLNSAPVLTALGSPLPLSNVAEFTGTALLTKKGDASSSILCGASVGARIPFTIKYFLSEGKVWTPNTFEAPFDYFVIGSFDFAAAS